MDIGTGKDIADYNVKGKIVESYLIDLIEPEKEYNLFSFMRNFHLAFDKICGNGKIPFLAGGTGLYLHSVLKDYNLTKVEFDTGRYEELNRLDLDKLTYALKRINPALHNTTDLLIKDRVIRAIIIAEGGAVKEEEKESIRPLVIGVRFEREIIKERITARLKHRLQNGMIDEVKNLVARGIPFERLELFGLEYKFVGRYLKGELNYDEMYRNLNGAIHSFAKRQMTWFRKMEREGIVIRWIEGPDFQQAEKIINDNYFS
jgi:tRNA dimethylallyltransferase